jgi:biotin-dependent carboxylase-like uncharacterized protein
VTASARPEDSAHAPGLRVLAAGPLTTVQDEGRPGNAAWGVTRSGACDRTSYRLANRLVGNEPGLAALEVTFGGLAVRTERDLVLAVTGARCPGVAWNAPVHLRTGQVLRLGTPERGLRTYVAVRGGIDVPPVLGSRATDTLSGLGPARVVDGDVLPVGRTRHPMPGVDEAPLAEPTLGPVRLRVTPGPRRDRFGDAGWAVLLGTRWQVSADSDRVGVRLVGGELVPEEAWRGAELPSEGVLRGAVQVPPSGRPVVFLADHPVTGGYPVIAYVEDGDDRSDVDRLAQVRPGQEVLLGP